MINDPLFHSRDEVQVLSGVYIHEHFRVAEIISVISSEYKNIDKYLKDLVLFNKSNSAPYHNFYHSCVVLRSCYLIRFSKEYLDIIKDPEHTRALFCAAIFHDFNHSQGLHSDDKNIQESIDSWKKSALRENESVDFINLVAYLIRYTQFPYSVETIDWTFDENKHVPIDLLKAILRDSDLSQICTDNYFSQNVIGLSKELNLPIKEFLQSQLSFIENVRWQTKVAHSFFDRYLRYRVIPELEMFIKLTND